ncbi:MAG: DoxX family protein [Anaerolineae bacterium]|nr:DoxX family protein [Anaerolineae bacterium]
MINTPENTTKLNMESGGFARYLAAIRHTRHDKILGSVRIALGILFLMTGLMKLFVPELRAAFSGQLTAADIPFHSLNMWIVPLVETAVGLLLLYGLFSRIGVLIVIGLMLVATYVHLVVSDPALFPLQPTEPIIPIMAIGAAVYVLWRGGGAWSADLNWRQN